MSPDNSGKPGRPSLSREELDEFVAKAKALNKERMQGYREQSLKIHPWVCARCGRHFTLKTLNQLTVHHKDHNHNNNPPDGSNWENLCVFCHDHEHGRDMGDGGADPDYHEEDLSMRSSPFARLGEMIKEKEKKRGK